jgi:hypothetical protein
VAEDQVPGKREEVVSIAREVSKSGHEGETGSLLVNQKVFFHTVRNPGKRGSRPDYGRAFLTKSNPMATSPPMRPDRGKGMAGDTVGTGVGGSVISGVGVAGSGLVTL